MRVLAIVIVLTLFSGCTGPPANQAPSGATQPTGSDDDGSLIPVPVANVKDLHFAAIGNASEWLIAFLPFGAGSEQLDYNFTVDVAAATGPGPGHIFAFAGWVDDSQEYGFQPGTFQDRYTVLVAPGQNGSLSIRPHVRGVGTSSGEFVGLFLAVASDRAWTLDVAAASSSAFAQPRMARGVGAHFEDVKVTGDSAHAGTFAQDLDIREPGWTQIQILNEPFSLGGATIDARAIQYKFAFADGFEWSGPGAGVWRDVPGVENGYTWLKTNRVVYTLEDKVGTFHAEATFAQNDARQDVVLMHLPGTPWDALGMRPLYRDYAQ
jgi:hypothetical protein